MSRPSRASRRGPVVPQEGTHDPPPSYSSAKSRSSISEASKAIDSGAKEARNKPGWVTSEKEEKELIQKKSLSTRLSSISRSTSAYVPPAQHVPAPPFSRSHLPTPDRSSPLKPTDRLTLRPPGTRTVAIPEAGETPQQDSSIKPFLPPTKLHVPKQKIKPLYDDPSIGKSKKSKKTGLVAPKTLEPTQLTEAEVGVWKEDGWVPADPKEVMRSDKDAMLGVEKPGLGTEHEELLPIQTAHHGTHALSPASSPQPLPSQTTNNRSITAAKYPRQLTEPLPITKQVEPLFTPAYDEEEETMAQIQARYNNNGSPVDPISRSNTRREYHVSPESSGSTSPGAPTALSLPPSLDCSRGSIPHDPTLIPSLPDRPSKNSRSASSPLKQPLTYGNKSKSMVPPAPAARTAKEERHSKKARYQKREAKMADAKKAERRATWRGKPYRETALRLPESNVRGCIPDPPESQDRPHRPPLGDISSNQLDQGIDDPFYGTNIRRVGSARLEDTTAVDAPNVRNDVMYANLAPRSGEEEDAFSPVPVEEKNAKIAEPWSRTRSINPTKSKKPRRSNHHRRSHSVSYHYREDALALAAIGAELPSELYTRQKRKYSTSHWPDDDSRQLKKNGSHRSRNGEWPGDLFHNTPAEERLHGFQPLSKYGDPAEQDRTRRMERDGLYVVREGKKEKLATTTGSRHRREHHLDTPARLKMSRRASAMDRVDEYVNKVSEHSKSSRSIRSLPSRSYIRKVKELPGYIVKPIKTISWEEYNAAYNDERPFPVDKELINRTMADLRAQYFRSNGKNRLTSAAKRRDREARAEERRIEGMSDIEERIDTVTPSQRPADTSFPKNMPTGRRIPKLHFTNRTPLPPLPVKSQKRKVTRLLEPERGEEEDDADWETAHRPDPIDVHSSDEEQPKEAVEVDFPVPDPAPARRRLPHPAVERRPVVPEAQRALVPASSQAKLPLPGQPPMRRSDTEAGRARRSTESEDLQSLGRFMVEQLGNELDEIVARHPNVEEEVEAMRLRASEARDEDFPSVPSAPNVPYRAAETAVLGSKMLTGTGMTDHLLEALQQTKAMFAARPTEAESHPSRSARNEGRRRRVAERRGPPGASKSSKRKERHPGERPGERDDSQLRLNFPPRATQERILRQDQDTDEFIVQRENSAGANDIRSRTHTVRRTQAEESTDHHPPEPIQPVQRPSIMDNTLRNFDVHGSAQGDTRTNLNTNNEATPAASASVRVRSQAVSLAGFPRATPRLGLSKTQTRGTLQPRTLLAPRTLVDRPTDMLRSQFRAPTQALPPQIAPRTQLSQFPRTPHSDLDTPDYQAGQRMPSPTQATTLANYTQATRSRSRWTSAARVSTTEMDSSPFDPFTSTTTIDPGIQASEGYTSYSDLYDDNAEPTRVASPVILDGMIDPARLIRRQSFSKVMPKSSTLRRSARNSGGKEEEGGEGSAGRVEQGFGGMAMSRIGSQRARRQFRPPTVAEPQRRR